MEVIFTITAEEMVMFYWLIAAMALCALAIMVSFPVRKGIKYLKKRRRRRLLRQPR